jgi:hypothetical protein
MIKVVSDAEAAKASFVICARKADPRPDFDDNLEGDCVRCGERVVFRWHVPLHVPKLCVWCLPDQMREDEA